MLRITVPLADSVEISNSTSLQHTFIAELSMLDLTLIRDAHQRFVSMNITRMDVA